MSKTATKAPIGQETLDELLAEWQGTLRLQDWDVEAAFRRAYDLTRVDVAGECRWVLSNKTAVIRILDPCDFDPDICRPQDVERTLVHELLHLHFAPFTPIGQETYEHEQAIEAIAKALVAAKRGRQGG